MPETPVLDINVQSRYLQQNRSVNVQETLQNQEKIKKNGLAGVEVRETPQQLGKNDFLKLLVTQLSYQDPTSPVKDQQFIAQMAQFSSLEQMQNMASSLGRLADRQAHELIGRYVMGRDFVSGENVGGIAQALFYDKEGKSFLKVNGRAIALKEVQLISDPNQIQKQYGGLGEKTTSSSLKTDKDRVQSEVLQKEQKPSQKQKEATKELQVNESIVHEK